jgi:sugar porter (SP) family MFS transporter
LSGIGGLNDWRWMLGVQAIPSILFLVTVTLIPESPRWLIVRLNDLGSARIILKAIDPDSVEETIRAIQQTPSGSQKRTSLFQKAYIQPITLAVLFAVFNQVSGINAIIYFAPRIFEMAGIGKNAALLSSAGIGLVNLISTLVGISLIDKYGRRALMLVGSVGLVCTLILVAETFYNVRIGLFVPIYLFVYIGFFAFSQGAVIWVFISEIFPNEVRASGQSLGSFTHWFMAAIITFTFPYLAEAFGGTVIFGFFAFMMLLQFLFAWKFMPETKGTSLENMDTVILSHA